MKLAFISNHPAPYRDPFLSRLVRSDLCSTDVYSLFPGDKGHGFWALDKPSYKATVIAKGRAHSICIFVRLLRFLFSDYDVICWPGLQHWYLVVLLLFSAVLRRKYGFCADSVAQGKISSPLLVIKEYIIRHAAFIFVPGEASVNFFRGEFSVRPEQILKGAYALDNEMLAKKVADLRCNDKRREIYSKFEIPLGARLFLMVANMTPGRHYPITSSGFVRFAKKHTDCVFMMVGNGADFEYMRQFAVSHPCLRVVNGCSFSEMLELYAAADVYVHGGKEPASTALVIGAISELPLISSYDVGCSLDVLIDGKTGVLVQDYASVEAWDASFERAYVNIEQWRAWGRQAHEMAEAIDVASTTKRFIDLIINLEEHK